MAIKFPSLSDLTIIPIGSGTPVGSGAGGSILGGGLSSSRTDGFDSEDAESLLTLSLARDRDNEILASQTSIYQYDSSFYDTEITGSGITSAYPVVVATLPMTNFFDAGNESNLGTLYEIQNELRDTVVSGANQIIEKYYQINPSVTASLASIRDANLEKYNKIVSNVPQIFRAKESIVAATNLSYPSDIQLLLVDQKVATTDAELEGVTSTPTIVSVVDAESILSAGIGNSVAGSVIGSIKYNITNSSVSTGDTTGYLGNISVAYNDDDVKKYTSGNDIISALESRLLGSNRNEQSRTTKQYQLLKAAIAQLTEGRRFNNIENESSYTSPYADLKYREISPISNFIADKISMNSDLAFAKNSIMKIAEIIDAGYSIGDLTYTDLLSKTAELNNSGIMYLSNWYMKENTVLTISGDGVPSIAFDTKIYDNDTPDRKTLPITGLNVSLLKYGFIEQIPLYLSSRIVEESVVLSDIPSSIDPKESQEISVNSTINDNLRFISQNTRGEKVYLFDDFLNGSIGTLATPVSTAILSSLEELESLKSDMDSIVSELDSFATDRKWQISNQGSMTIAQTFYKHLKSFFSNSALGGSDSTYSAMRICLLLAAAKSSFAAARVWRLISADGEEATGRIGRGDDAPSTGRSNDTNQTILDTILGANYEYGSYGNGLTSQKRLTNGANTLGGDINSLTKSGEDTPESFLQNLYDPSGSFSVFDNIVNELSSYYPIISTNSKLRTEIKLSAYYMILYFFRKLNFTCYFKIQESENTDGETGRNLISYRVILTWYPKDTAFIADSLEESISNTSTESMQFSQFNTVILGAPTDSEKSLGQEYFFNSIRGVITTTLQASQDIKSLIAYQQTVLKTQSSLISEIKNFFENLAEIYGGDNDKAKKLVSRYSSLDSVVEMLYRSNRYQTLIPDTGISSIASRSSNYRSIVKTAFRDSIPKKENLSICVVGIPYGMLERMRFTQDDRNYYFGVSAHAGSAKSFDENSPRVDFSFKFVESSQTIRPLLGGPFCSLVPELYDDFASSGEVSSVSDDSISFYQISNDGSKLEVKKRSDSSSNVKSIDIPLTINQAALQSYIEDVYGLYPRYASFKESFSTTSFPELAYATEALKLLGYSAEGTNDDILLYYRLKSMIMFHKDFVTSRMISEIEASPLFDKIVYLLIDGNNFDDVINEFYVKAEV